MKTIFKFCLVLLCAAGAVAACALIPPYATVSGDASFLDVVKVDNRREGTYEYKATEYQKVKILCETLLERGFLAVYDRRQINGTIEADEAPAGFAETVNSPFAYLITEEGAEGRMNRAQAKDAAITLLTDWRQAGILPYFVPNGEASYIDDVYPITVSDPTVANTSFVFWIVTFFAEESGTMYIAVIDDENGNPYYLSIDYYGEDQKSALANWSNTQSARSIADAFAHLHNLTVGEPQSEDYGDAEFLLYPTDNADYAVCVNIDTAYAFSVCAYLRPNA